LAEDIIFIGRDDDVDGVVGWEKGELGGGSKCLDN